MQQTQTGPKSLTLCLLYVQQVVQSRAAVNVQVTSSLPSYINTGSESTILKFKNVVYTNRVKESTQGCLAKH